MRFVADKDLEDRIRSKLQRLGYKSLAVQVSEREGEKIVEVSINDDRIDVLEVLRALRADGADAVIVEGGALRIKMKFANAAQLTIYYVSLG